MITKDREYRHFTVELRASEENEMIVEGYAARFDESTVLYSFGGIDYKEVIERTAFDLCNMNDVVMNYNHAGKPVARTKNNTLQLNVDEIGLKIRADLSGTEEGRRLYEEIRGGYIDKMSFAFNIFDDGDSYDKETHTRHITKLQRLYDVAAVDQPAYDTTSIYARSYFSAEAEREKAEALELKKRKLNLLILCG